jgi:hypothetical protein
MTTRFFNFARDDLERLAFTFRELLRLDRVVTLSQIAGNEFLFFDVHGDVGAVFAFDGDFYFSVAWLIFGFFVRSIGGLGFINCFLVFVGLILRFLRSVFVVFLLVGFLQWLILKKRREVVLKDWITSTPGLMSSAI